MSPELLKEAEAILHHMHGYNPMSTDAPAAAFEHDRHLLAAKILAIRTEGAPAVVKKRYVLVGKTGYKLAVIDSSDNASEIKQLRREAVLDCDGMVLAIDIQTGEPVSVP